jgi:CO/xanthine dehydrogenase Mo-binding subunit
MTDLTYVGKRLPRYDGMQHVTARTRFVGDLSLPGLLHVKAWRSPVPSAWVRDVDVSSAEALPGVVKVITHADVPSNIYGFAVDMPVLAESEVRYLGQEVAAVAAEDEYTARRAVEMIRVELDEREPVLDPLEAMKPGAPQVAPGGNLVRFGDQTVRRVRKGDLEAAFAAADAVIEGRFRSQGQEHAPIETQVSLAQTDAMGRTHIWSVGQAPFFQQPVLAGILGKPQSKVHLVGGVVGGAFGGKTDLHADHICSVLSLYTDGRPVRWQWTRAEEMQASTCRGAMHMWFEDAVTSDGRIVGRKVRSIRDGGAYVLTNEYVMSKHAFGICGPYDIPNVDVEALAVLTNKRPTSSMRGFGLYQASFAEQVQMERIADRLGLDPWRVRLINAVRDGETTATRTELHSCGLIEVVQALAERVGKHLDPDLASLSSGTPRER